MTKWKVLKTEELFKSGIFRLRCEQCELPDGRVMPRYYIFDFPGWVHSVAVDRSGELIMLRQYRHGAGLDFIEIPGGTLDPRGESDPLLAAQRELREETGYASSRWLALPVQYPNPALQSNKLFAYVALDCEKVGEPELDPYEDLQVELMKIEDVYKAAEQGLVGHSLMLSTLFLARQLLLTTK